MSRSKLNHVGRARLDRQHTVPPINISYREQLLKVTRHLLAHPWLKEVPHGVTPEFQLRVKREVQRAERATRATMLDKTRKVA